MASCPCCESEIVGSATLQACFPYPVVELRSAVSSLLGLAAASRPLVCSMAFPPGITAEGATPKNGGEMVNFGVHHLPFPVAHQRLKSGGRSLHFLPLQARRAVQRGATLGTAPPRLSQPTRGIRANPCPIRLSRQGPDHSSEKSPSEREALWWSKTCATWCATYVRHPLFVRWTPIRRHVLDPRRRKSSIISRPFEAGFSCSHWTTFSMPTSKPPWRSTVSCPRNPRALPARLGFPGPWHARAPRNASCTDFRLRDRRSRHLWGNRNSRLAQWSPFGRGQPSRRNCSVRP